MSKSIYKFHATIHARPAEAKAGGTIELGGRTYRTLVVPQAALCAPMARSFEEVVAELSRLERMYCEPDGAFVWVSPSTVPSWQVDGVLYDRDRRLLLVDVKGACPAEEFDRLLAAFGWPETELVFQSVQEAVFFDEQEFRQFAAAASRAPNN